MVQFNRVDNYNVGAQGSDIKSRGLQDIIRYNYVGDGAARAMDLVDVQDGPAYMSFVGFLGGGVTGSYKGAYVNDVYPADQLAAEQEAFNAHFIYGNIYLNSSSGVPIHFAEDQIGNELARKGMLYWYNNTFYEKACTSCNGQRWTLFDTTAGSGGTIFPQVEYQTVQAFDNVIALEDPTRPFFSWNNDSAFIGVAGKNLLSANWGSNDMSGRRGYGLGCERGDVPGCAEPGVACDGIYERESADGVDDAIGYDLVDSEQHRGWDGDAASRDLRDADAVRVPAEHLVCGASDGGPEHGGDGYGGADGGDAELSWRKPADEHAVLELPLGLVRR